MQRDCCFFSVSFGLSEFAGSLNCSRNYCKAEIDLGFTAT